MKAGFKTAIITGGSKGIGLRIAKILAKEKYNIVICSRNFSDLQRAKKETEVFKVKCLAVKTDVLNYNQCKLLIKKTLQSFSRIDLLVNNAGIQGPVGKLWENNIKEWEKTIQINLLGTFYMSCLVIPYMLKQKSGVIINLSGGGAAYARPLFSAYGCSKTAVLRLTETLAEELKGKNIKVFALAPGVVWTKMTKEALLKAKKVSDKKTIQKLELAKKDGGTSQEKLEKVILYLLDKKSNKLAGKLIHVNELDKIKKKSLKPGSGLLRRVDYPRK